MWRGSFACQRRPIVGVLGVVLVVAGGDCLCCPRASVHRLPPPPPTSGNNFLGTKMQFVTGAPSAGTHICFCPLPHPSPQGEGVRHNEPTLDPPSAAPTRSAPPPPPPNNWSGTCRGMHWKGERYPPLQGAQPTPNLQVLALHFRQMSEQRTPGWHNLRMRNSGRLLSFPAGLSWCINQPRWSAPRRMPQGHDK